MILNPSCYSHSFPWPSVDFCHFILFVTHPSIVSVKHPSLQSPSYISSSLLYIFRPSFFWVLRPKTLGVILLEIFLPPYTKSISSLCFIFKMYAESKTCLYLCKYYLCTKPLSSLTWVIATVSCLISHFFFGPLRLISAKMLQVRLVKTFQ